MRPFRLALHSKYLVLPAVEVAAKLNLPKQVTLPAEATITVPASIASLLTGLTIPEGAIELSLIILKECSKLAAFNIPPKGTSLSTNFVLPRGTTLPADTKVPSGTVLPVGDPRRPRAARNPPASCPVYQSACQQYQQYQQHPLIEASTRCLQLPIDIHPPMTTADPQ